jgi:hypothetical protein
MTAVLHDDRVMTPPAPRRTPVGAPSDPLADAAARLLSIPLRQVYALLWRVGLIEVLA